MASDPVLLQTPPYEGNHLPSRGRWRLSSFYFFYFSMLGIFAPYWGLFLKENRFSTLEIAQLTSLLMWTKIFAPNLWGWLSDHTGKRISLIRLGAVLSLLIFTLHFYHHSYWGYFWVLSGFSFFWNAILPQMEVITLFNLGDKRTQYGKIRLWGSWGFIVSVTAVGLLFDHIGIRSLPVILWGALFAIWLTTLIQKKEPHNIALSSSASFLKTLKNPQIILFIIVSFLLQLSHGAYYTWYSILLKENGYSAASIGGLWSLGVIAEIILFFYMHRIFKLISLKSIFLIALFLTTVRWLLIAEFYELFWMMILSQLLHAASFGAMHAASIHYIHLNFSGKQEGQGQALYSSLGFGAGGALGALLSGFIVSTFYTSSSFLFSAMISALAFILISSFFKENLAMQQQTR